MNSAGAECEARNGAECGSEQGAESEVDCEVESVHVVWLCDAKSNWYMWCGFVCALRVAVASGGAACGVEGLKVNQWRAERVDAPCTKLPTSPLLPSQKSSEVFKHAINDLLQNSF